MLNRTDQLLLAYFGGVGILVGLGSGQTAALALVGAAIASLLLAAAAAERWPGAGVVHDLWPVPLIVLGYEASGALTALVGAEAWDARLAAADARWFGVVVESWRAPAGRPALLTELACVAYASFYVLPVVVAVRLRARDRAAFAELVQAMTLTFVGSWLLYAIAPASGPRDPQALGDGPAGRGLTALLRVFEQNRFDAFPSGHTAIALLTAWFGARHLRRGAPIVVGVALAIVFSTVYLSFHYVVDVVAGAGLACATLAALWLARRVHDPRAHAAAQPGRSA